MVTPFWHPSSSSLGSLFFRNFTTEFFLRFSNSYKMKRTYITRQKEAERLKKLVSENRGKKRPRDVASSDDDSSPSQVLGAFELGLPESPEIQSIPPWSDDEGDEGDSYDDEVEVLGKFEGGSCSKVKKGESFTANVRVIDVDLSKVEKRKKKDESFSGFESVGSVFEDEEDEEEESDSGDEDYKSFEKEESLDEDDDEEESYSEEEVMEKKGKKGKKKQEIVTSQHKSRKNLSFGASGRKKSGYEKERSKTVMGNKKGGNFLEESKSQSESDVVVIRRPDGDDFKKKIAAKEDCKSKKQASRLYKSDQFVKGDKKGGKFLIPDESKSSRQDDVVVIRRPDGDDFKKKKMAAKEDCKSKKQASRLYKSGKFVKGDNKGGKFMIRDESKSSNENDHVVVIRPKGDDFRKKKREKAAEQEWKSKKKDSRLYKSDKILKGKKKGERFLSSDESNSSSEDDHAVVIRPEGDDAKKKKKTTKEDCISNKSDSRLYRSDSSREKEKHEGTSGVNTIFNNGSEDNKGQGKGGTLKKDKAVSDQGESGSFKHGSDLLRKASKARKIDGKDRNLGGTNSSEDENDHVCCSCVKEKARKCEDQKDKKENPKRTEVRLLDPVDKAAQDSNTGFAMKSETKNVEPKTPSRPFCVGIDEDGQEEVETVLGENVKKEEHFGMKEKKQSVYSDRDPAAEKTQPTKMEDDPQGSLGERENVKEEKVHVHAPKNFDLVKALASSIFDEDEARLRDIGSSGDVPDNQKTNSPAEQPTLPLKFRFGVVEKPPPEKSDSEKEMDRLWDQLEFLNGCSKIGSADHETLDNDDLFPQDSSVDATTRCGQGNHHFILDEEIGIVCKYCPVVKLEIKYVIPSFITNPWGRQSEKRERKRQKERDNDAIFNKIQLEDFGYDSHPGVESPIYTNGTVWELVPGAYNIMYPHQREGFEFIWRNIGGSINQDELKNQTNSSRGGGCIISHAPGTGKSRLTIVFLQAYLRFYPECRPVLIAPKQMLLAWNEELIKWKVDIPFHNMSCDGFSGKENVAAKNLCDRAKHHRRKVTTTRLVKLFSWKKEGGILGISYTLFEKLAGGGKPAEKESKRKPKDCHFEDKQIEKALLQIADLLVLDEGHTPRNKKSSIFKVLSNIRTEKRIILSGTPFQNNFDELFNTICLVRPRFIESFRSNLYFHQNPAQRQNEERKKWNDLISPIGKASDRNSLKRLQGMLEPFVHIHKGDILREKLPGLKAFVLILKPGELQKSLLEGIQGVGDQFTINHLSSLVSVHPALLPEPEYERFSHYVDAVVRDRMNPDAGAKIKFLIELVKLCQSTNEKVLVFGEFLPPLTFIIEQLKSCFGWADGRELLYMDGQVDIKQRQSFLNVFNDSTSEAKVLMASIKAFGEGINLVGASRVVLLDVVWNPSVERQAISRAYRIGQKKIVYVYQLISGSETMERGKYDRQVDKKRLSKLIFSSNEADINAHNASSAVEDANGSDESCSDEILEELRSHDKLKSMFEKVYYQSKESELNETFALVDEDIANGS